MKLLIRADAGPRIGTGHVMRCLSLAQGGKQAGGDALFVSRESTPALEQRLHVAGFEVARLNAASLADDAAQTVEIARAYNAEWIVADGYQFDSEYQRRIKKAGFRLLLIDDNGHAERYLADLVLNQNLHATAALYANREAYTVLLLGTQYALLRQEFLAYKDWNRAVPVTARKILVTLGGADPDNVTGKVIQALSGLNLQAKVVVGGSSPHIESLRSSLSRLPSSIQLVVDAKNMPELMAWADVAVAAGGTTAWELAFMGLPAIVIVLAQNQSASVERLSQEGIVFSLNRQHSSNSKEMELALKTLLTDPERRGAMSQRGRRLVDGNGVIRVWLEMSRCFAAH